VGSKRPTWFVQLRVLLTTTASMSGIEVGACSSEEGRWRTVSRHDVMQLGNWLSEEKAKTVVAQWSSCSGTVTVVFGGIAWTLVRPRIRNGRAHARALDVASGQGDGGADRGTTSGRWRCSATTSRS
jgi:hypothetical protein